MISAGVSTAAAAVRLSVWSWERRGGAALLISCLQGALPPVDFLAVCLVRAIVLWSNQLGEVCLPKLVWGVKLLLVRWKKHG